MIFPLCPFSGETEGGRPPINLSSRAVTNTFLSGRRRTEGDGDWGRGEGRREGINQNLGEKREGEGWEEKHIPTLLCFGTLFFPPTFQAPSSSSSSRLQHVAKSRPLHAVPNRSLKTPTFDSVVV